MHRILMLLVAAALFALAASGCSDDASTTSAPDEDLTPPAAPVNLSVSIKGDQVTVAWRENSEIDLANYRIYRSINERDLALASASDQARFVDTLDESGLLALSYQVSAVDENDNESALSAVALIVVDLSEPIIASEIGSD
jgi:hypothetical protein